MRTEPEPDPERPPQADVVKPLSEGWRHLKSGLHYLQTGTGKVVDHMSKSLQHQWQSNARAAANVKMRKEAGALVAEGVFGTTAVEIYEGGYTRVAKSPDGREVGELSPETPFEELISIHVEEEESLGGQMLQQGAVALTSVVAASTLSKRKGSLGSLGPGLAALGVDHFMKQLARKTVLTIVTDHQVHTVTNEQQGPLGVSLPASNDGLGQRLVSVGKRVIANSPPEHKGVLESSSRGKQSDGEESAPEKQPRKEAGRADVVEKIRELSSLHEDGLLTDQEFSAAKGRLLEQI